MWDRLWFAPATAESLGVARALILGGLLAIYARNDFAAYGSVSAVFHDPAWLPVAPETWLRAMNALWLSALALGCVGLFTRAALTAAFLLGGYLLALDASFGRVHHNDLAVFLALGILAASRAGDALSLDALRRRAAPPRGDAEYGWPLRAIQLTLALAFLAAGIAKLRHGGLEWITSENLRLRLLDRGRLLVPSRGFGDHLARFPLLCHAVAAATVAIELLYPLSLVSARARAVLVPASLLMLLGFALFFGPRFTTLAVLSVAWAPWDPLLARLRRRTTAGAASAPAP
jgi:hypothetical protein